VISLELEQTRLVYMINVVVFEYKLSKLIDCQDERWEYDPRTHTS
jgi:hypothetical protein